MPERETGPIIGFRQRMIHGPDFRALSPEARWVFAALKMYLNPKSYGIQVHNELTLPIEIAGCTGYAPDVVAQALGELRTKTADKSTGATWIEQEANVVWIVDHLRHDPSFHVANWNMCKSVVGHVKTLPNLSIVERFRAHYAAIIQHGEESRPSGSLGERSATIVQPVVSGGIIAPPMPVSRLITPTEPPVRNPSSIAEVFAEVTLTNEPAQEVQVQEVQQDMFGNPVPPTPPPPKPKKPKAPPKANWATPYFDVWEAAFDGDRFASGEGVRYLKPLHDKHGQGKVVAHLKNYCEHHKDPRQRQFARMPAFAQTFSIWERPRPVRTKNTKHAVPEVTGFLSRSTILEDIEADD